MVSVCMYHVPQNNVNGYLLQRLVLLCWEARGRAALAAGAPLPSQNLFQEPPEMKSYGFVETDTCLYIWEHVTFQDHYVSTR